MGKVIRQGISSGIFIYIGMVLGFVNATILFPKYLGKEVYGFCQFLIYISELLAVFSLLGAPNVIVRFFPRFRDKDPSHGGLIGFIMTIVGVTTLLVTGLLLLLRPSFISWFGGEGSGDYLARFYGGLIIFFIFTNLNTLLNNYSTALQRPRVPTFFGEIGSRLITFSLIFLFIIQWIDEDQFIQLYTLKLLPITLGLLFFLYLIGEWKTRPNFRIIKQPIFHEMKAYGLYAVFAKIGRQLVNRIDIIMITALLSLGDVGIYALFYFLSQVIMKTHEGIGKMANPMIAEYWQHEKLGELKTFYKRTALNNWVAAVLIFVGIIANLENAILLVGEEYRPGMPVAIFLGIAQLVNVVNGYNGLVLIHSPYYRFDLIFKFITAAFTVISNYLFINWMGLTGAAVATALTLVLQNLMMQSFLYRKLGIHPFSRPMLTVALFSMVALGIGLLLPRVEWHYILDIILRSGTMSVAFGLLVLLFNPAPDITDYFWKLAAKVGIHRS